MYSGVRDSGAIGGGATTEAGAASPGKQTQVEAAAARGTAGPGGAMPFADSIQRSFGRHDISGIEAHTDGAAAEAAGEIGAEAYATGNHVAFGGAPDLHTAAHEAAHVVQQRGGVHLAGGVGAEGDPYEQHADAVADRVVAGASAVDLLDVFSGGAPSAAPVQRAVQRKVFIKNRIFRGHSEKRASTKPEVQALIDAGQSHYFDNETEMDAFAAGTLDTAGFMTRPRAWVHLPSSLLVLGEQHGATPNALTVIAATGTTRYAHEAMAAAPTNQANPALATALGERGAEHIASKDVDGATADNAGEDFLPKMIRILPEIQIDVAADKVTNTPWGQRALKWGILYAREDGGNIAAVYNQSKAMFDAIAADDGKVPAATDAAGVNMIARLVDVLLTHARQDVARRKAGLSKKERRGFEAGRAASRYTEAGDTPEHRLMDEGDDARDLSMYEHIKQAKDDGKLIYGLGDNHRKRLAPMLATAGIAHKKVEEFVAEQQAKYPQV